MVTLKTILLACSALTAAAIVQSETANAQNTLLHRDSAGAIILAQAPPPAAPDAKKTEEEKKKAPPPAAKPVAPPPPPHPPVAQPHPPAAPPHPPAAPPPPPVAQPHPPAAPPHPPVAQPQRPAAPPHPPVAQPHAPAVAPPPPAAQAKPTAPPPPPSAQAKPTAPPPPPAAQAKPVAPPPPAAAQNKPALQPAAAPPPPTKPQSAGQFIQRKGEKPSGGLADVRKERKETHEGNRTVIREGDRTIVRDGNRATISHNEADRFAIGARNVKVDRKGNDTISIVLRPNGFSIVSTTDRDGHLLRRVRRDRNGRDVVIIDNSFAGAQRDNYFVDVRAPQYRGPRDRYIVDAGRADRAFIYGALSGPPIERIERRYTLDQVRYSEPLREYMPRVDLDVNFATGSWQLSPGQVDALSVIAQGINDAVNKNPREVFLIEGHTDKVGSADDNLSLSDRRAEAVAVALTEQFGVPPENLVTQGYGEEYPKIDTDGPSRENRRVAVRRITPLIDQVAGR